MGLRWKYEKVRRCVSFVSCCLQKEVSQSHDVVHVGEDLQLKQQCHDGVVVGEYLLVVYHAKKEIILPLKILPLINS